MKKLSKLKDKLKSLSFFKKKENVHQDHEPLNDLDIFEEDEVLESFQDSSDETQSDEIINPVIAKDTVTTEISLDSLKELNELKESTPPEEISPPNLESFENTSNQNENSFKDNATTEALEGEEKEESKLISPSEYHTQEIDLNYQPTKKELLQEKIASIKSTISDRIQRFKHKRSRFPTDPQKTGFSLESIKSSIQQGHLKSVKESDASDFHRYFLEPKNLGKLNHRFLVACLILGIYNLGKLTALSLASIIPTTPSGKELTINIKKTSSQEYDALINSPLFKSKQITVEPIKRPVEVAKKDEDLPCIDAKEVSRLPLKLVNTVVMQDSVKSMASVQVRNGQDLQFYRPGESVDGLAKIERVNRLKVILKNLKNGNCEFLENIDAKNANQKFSSNPIRVMSPNKAQAFKQGQEKLKGIETDGSNFTIEKSFIKSKLTNISDILTQARGIQLANPDGSISFKIVEIQPGSVFSHLGIQNEDIITEINGKKISNLNQVMMLFGKLGNLDNLKLNVNRGGSSTPLNYTFK